MAEIVGSSKSEDNRRRLFETLNSEMQMEINLLFLASKWPQPLPSSPWGPRGGLVAAVSVTVLTVVNHVLGSARKVNLFVDNPVSLC